MPDDVGTPPASPAAEPTALDPGSGDTGSGDLGFRDPGFGDFDELVATLDRWSVSLPQWPPAATIASEWTEIGPRLDRARRELARVLVVGVVGGTGTGKSTLVNALAGADVSAAGDVTRPTTTAPVVVAAPGVDLGWLPLEAVGARVVRSTAPAVAHVVFVDCPDPDTQPVVDGHASRGGTLTGDRASAANRNRDLLEQVLPACDVLLFVATAQKYKSWIVAREVAAFAPGRPLFFVQTRAALDPDIRADWRRTLESQGFSVPRIFRTDGVEAGRRAAAGLDPGPGFAELLAAIDAELVGRAARRVRRTGALDLATWFMRDCGARLEPLAEPVRDLVSGIDVQRARLERILAASVTGMLRGQRDGWQRFVAGEIVERWQGGPFALLLQIVAWLGTLWRRTRLGGGLVGRLLSGGPSEVRADAPAGWQAVEELGLTEAEVEQSRGILAGLAMRARVGGTMVGRGRLEDARIQSLAHTVLDRAGRWLAVGIERMVEQRRSRLGGPLVHWIFELLFAGLLVAVLVRAGWNFFYGHLWLGLPLEGGGFLQQALVWLVVWGLVLRWIVLRLVRWGLDRDIAAVVGGLPQARLVDPLLADYADAAGTVAAFLDEGRRLGAATEQLAARLDGPAGGLGRLRAAPQVESPPQAEVP
jgi:energy-coupling factor transporter ATP-binding protein EcfA2